ncbi:tetrahydrofolate dehydrogenase/cyclohydrolase catalytic domain-containing protein [Saccharopolyspora sp. TS4A08]|uniref:Tetrahydrofolate dehydrogenase/cyclohydrolase catalytic domain-containing protein n=1 Tax=Saccharopolyspora ipomoeae TaxID=3042027 RepID=A0ABT6PUY3_9PSEU|nr:tetrahydrofolate dehydrogenase/cyclohydrolase catalytic domain-containing protein [Saccharopolyspora sp. TS4A08]MDI2031797.1 tetrahydrofolate dehydrogenase/cyclohydrolase catalytic domain-containing protein [Saccharopolyspora sp. TS4A08]
MEEDVHRLRAEGLGIGLATVVVGEEYSSAAYERRLRRLADELGVPYSHQHLNADATQDDVLARIAQLTTIPRSRALTQRSP